MKLKVAVSSKRKSEKEISKIQTHTTFFSSTTKFVSRLFRQFKEKSLIHFAPKKRSLIIVFIIILLVGLLYFFKNIFIVAIVNGRPITRLAVVRELEKRGGKQALSSIISETLIFQEAARQKISVSDEEIEEEINKIQTELEKSGQNLNELLLSQGLTRSDVVKQTKIRLLLQKMLAERIKVTEDEASEYIEENKEQIPSETDEVQLRKSVEEELKNRKLNTAVQSWLKELEDKANILYFLNYE